VVHSLENIIIIIIIIIIIFIYYYYYYICYKISHHRHASAWKVSVCAMFSLAIVENFKSIAGGGGGGPPMA
jgi:cytochrome c oxidase assembly factor CtaG